MANVCNNSIHINYRNFSDIECVLISNEIRKRFDGKFEYYDMYEDDEIIYEIYFDSKWTAPYQFLKELSDELKIDIIGVAYEFGCGYVDAFEFLYDDTDDSPVPFINNELPVIKEGEEVNEIPKYQDVDILEKDYPDPDDIKDCDFTPFIQ